jgi:protein TonB
MDLGAGTALEGRRMAAALAASTLVHALAIVVLVSHLRTGAPVTPVVVFPISLVSLPGNGGSPGGGAPGPPATPPATPPPSPSPIVEPAPPPPATAAPVPPKPIAKPKPAAPPPAAPAPTVSPPGFDAAPSASPDGTASGAGAGGAGHGGSGAGPGGRGGGSTPGYGTNPQPPYPVVARRLRLEGTVLLRIVVASDGSPRDVSIARSSGHEALDDSAATTVRTRWRFVPASKDGRPIEDTVTVPIQFRIRDDPR